MKNEFHKPSINQVDESTASLFLSKPITELPGIGAKSALGFSRLHIHSVKDFIYSFPFRYETIEVDLQSEKSVLTGIFENGGIIYTGKGKRMYKAVFSSDSGYFSCVWLNFNVNYPSGMLHHGKKYYFYGTITTMDRMPSIFHPEFINPNDIGSVRSIYSSPTGFSALAYRKALNTAMDIGMKGIKETLPTSILEKYKFPNIHDAINTIHNPQTVQNTKLIIEKSHPAIKRFIYEELFYLHISMLLKKDSYIKTNGISFNIDMDYLNEISKIMPFKLTKAQKRVIAEVFNNMKNPKQMNRLVQGDVGSGKTILAFISAAVAIHNGYQATLIAPTEVLAEQHFNNAKSFFEKLNINIAIITGSTTKKKKEEIKNLLKEGFIKVIFGTHAIIEEDVEFQNLGFVIVDEQHRFGVHQRKILMEKGYKPDILLMTATPIPRTLAMTLYGDLDVSVIDELPPGRIPIKTIAYTEKQIEKAYSFVEEILNTGKKAYFVYPLIDESDKLELKAATQSYEEIKSYFKNKKVGLLHGKMKADEKRSLLMEFKNGDMDILVSTTVIEVGVDVPDAVVMVIENVERFGLSQLHQLRGRVGRNSEQSYCLLIGKDNMSENGRKRISAMVNYTDGFKLAEVDLEIRGQGDFFGTKQSGLPSLRFADILKDTIVISQSKNDALDILENDPKLEHSDNKIILESLKDYYKDSTSYYGIG